MKTNQLYVCQFCDKRLGSKRTVRGHISNIHKVDPDTAPLMYHVILVSPKVVNNLLISVEEEVGLEKRVKDSGLEMWVEDSGLDKGMEESGLEKGG